MANEGQIIGQGQGSSYAFGAYANPSAQRPQAEGLPTPDAVDAPQSIPGVEEYYKAISNFKGLVAGAKEMGIDITKPDYSDPDRMAAYNLGLQAQGKIAALGARLKKGAVLEQELGKRIAKGETVVGENFNFNVPLNEQYLMQNTRFAGTPAEVTGMNEQLGKSAQTVSAYRAAKRDYERNKQIFRDRLRKAEAANQPMQAEQARQALNSLVEPRLENVNERIQAQSERDYNAKAASAKIKENELNVQANTLSFAFNALDKSFETDANGNVVLSRSGDPTTTQAVKDAIGMVVGAQAPGKPNTQVLGASVGVHNGKPALILRYQQYEDYAESNQKGNDSAGDKNVFTTKGRRAVGPERGFIDVKYLDGESQASTKADVMSMINEGRAKRGEAQIGYERIATDRELNPGGYRTQSYLPSGESIIEQAIKGNQPIAAYREDVNRLARQFPEMQQLERRIQQNISIYGRDSEIVKKDELAYNQYLNNAFNKVNEMYTLKAGKTISRSESQSNSRTR